MKKAALILAILIIAGAALRAADLPERWVYISMNLMYDDDTDALVKIIGEARAAGATHIQLSDYQSAMMYDMGPRYFANVEKVKKAAKAAGITMVPAIFPIGMSGRYLFHNPNLADGLPVRDMRFVVKNGAAVVDPSLKPEVANGSFSADEKGAPTGWRVEIGPAASMTRSETDEGDAAAMDAAKSAADIQVTVDGKVKHSGAGSLKVAALGDVQKAKRFRAGASQVVKVKPFHTYRLSVWMKTDGIMPERHPVQICGARDRRQLCYSYFMRDTEANWPPTAGSTDCVTEKSATSVWQMQGTDFGMKPTGDWAEYKVAFNTLDYDEIEIFAGFSRVGRGTIWFDDIELEPAGLLNVVRRDLTPVTVKSADGKTTYVETVDYKRIEDPKLGVAPSRGDFQAASYGTFEIWHAAPSIALTDNSRIKDGDALLVSFYAPGIIYVKQQVTVSMSDPASLAVMDDEMKWVARVWGSDAYFMSYDEIRSGGWEPQPGGAKLTPGQILAEHVKRAVEIVHKYAPAAKIYVWCDMFDPYHNARELSEGQYYYLVNGSWAGSWEGLPKDVIIYNWSGNAKSAKWFADRGYKQVLSGSTPEKWLEDTKGLPGIIGLSYTNWEGDYSGMADYFSRMKAWKPGSASTESTVAK